LLRPQLEHDLDAYSSHWVGESRAACFDRRRGTESDTWLDRRRACLQRGIDAFATVGEIIGQAEPTNLADLPRAVQSMPDPASCSDSDGIESQIAPAFDKLAPVQRQITNARILVGAGRYEQAVASARKVVEAARTLGDGPALAEALLVQGRAQAELPDRNAALPILAEATHVALSSHADALAVEAWARRAGAQLRADPDGAMAGIDVIEPIARRTTSATYARAILYNVLGNSELLRDRKAQAREYFARGLTESQKLTGDAALDLLSARTNLPLASEDRGRADALLIELDAELTHRLGADHPDALKIRALRGSATIENLQQAERVLAPVCQAYGLHVGLAIRSAQCWTELGLLRVDLGDSAGAIEAMTHAMQAPSETQEAAAYTSLLQGNPQAAVQQFADAVAAAVPKPNEHLWERVPRARLTLGLGRARRSMNDLPGAREALERAIADLEPVVREYADTSYQRRLGRARVELAFTLSSMGVSTLERIAVAKAAAEWLRRAGGSPVELEKLEDLMKE
jgi:tetratricopeptide (TPR) repeat protein